MRSTLIFMLLASAAAPALAAGDDGERRSARIEARIDRAERSERRESDARSSRPAREVREVRDVRVVRDVRPPSDPRHGIPVVRPLPAPLGETARYGGGSPTDHRRRRSGGHGDYHRDIERDHRDLHDGDPSRREHRRWHRDAGRDHYSRHASWSTGWRYNNYYNWWDHRSRYGSLFRLGRYYDPYGYGYRRFQIGFSIGPAYYSQNHRFDPYRYRLPQAYGPYQWVRYYDDAVLVDTYTGQVVDVIYNFFW